MFSISPVAYSLAASAQAKIDQKTKPLGALGRLEEIALQVALIQGCDTPQISNPHFIVFAADHGVVAEGISPFPQEVTPQMVLNFLNDGAAINCFCRQHNIALSVVDAGVAAELPEHPALQNSKIAFGTQNFASQPAMSAEQLHQAFLTAKEVVASKAVAGCNLMGFGEMGIGNTTSAAALMAVLLNLDPSECVGRGTGLDSDGVTHKADVIRKAIALHCVDATKPMDVLACFGGFEVAMMVAGMLEAASQKMVVLVDGFIASAAALVACRIEPLLREYLVFCHRSNEQAHGRLLDALDAQPLLDLGLRLGEGSGAAVAYPLIKSAVTFLNEMASFESAGVSNRDDE